LAIDIEAARLSQVLDLFVEDDQLNIYAGELEVRPPGAPTTAGPYGRRLAGPSGAMTLI
jgi:hypothetical protein